MANRGTPNAHGRAAWRRLIFILKVLLLTKMRRSRARWSQSAVAKAVTSTSSSELATVVMFSLAGLDLSVWLFAEGVLHPPGTLVKALLLLG